MEVVPRACKCSVVSGCEVKKFRPNLIMSSTGQAGWSHFPAYLTALPWAEISSAVDNPRPSIIDLKVKAATSPAKFNMPVITVVSLLKGHCCIIWINP